ncbi:hypothetical protein Tco_0652641 [Tanacetum coccineum]|uniref:Uncharacterized protein n=1 Tax=Tanacetum coccineum TaxID=301880 RepID=A0ABQ4WY74_9ASTR
MHTKHLLKYSSCKDEQSYGNYQIGLRQKESIENTEDHSSRRIMKLCCIKSIRTDKTYDRVFKSLLVNLKSMSNALQLDYEDLKQIDADDLEEMYLKCYQMGLESLEARIVIHEKNEAVYEKDIAFLKYDVQDLDDYVYKTKVGETETNVSKTSKDIVKKPKTVRPSAPIIEE